MRIYIYVEGKAKIGNREKERERERERGKEIKGKPDAWVKELKGKGNPQTGEREREVSRQSFCYFAFNVHLPTNERVRVQFS